MLKLCRQSGSSEDATVVALKEYIQKENFDFSQAKGIQVSTRAIELLARELDTIYASHFIGDVVNLCALVLERLPESAAQIRQLDEHSHSHIGKFISVNALLDECDRFKDFPEPSVSDSFVLLSEEVIHQTMHEYFRTQGLTMKQSLQHKGNVLRSLFGSKLDDYGRPHHFNKNTWIPKFATVEEVLRGEARRFVLSNTIRTNGLELHVTVIDTSKPAPRRVKPSSGSLVDLAKATPRKSFLPIRMVKEGDRADVWCGVDLGIRYVVGACAIFKDGRRRNLAVKKSALAQPGKLYQQYLSNKKSEYLVADGAEAGTILDLEAESPKRKEGESSAAFFNRYLQRRDKLAAFYRQRCILKRHWDLKNSERGEFDRLTEALLEMVGGNCHKKVNAATSPIFAIGVGRFSTDGSLHSSFIKHFIKKVSALGYRCLGVSEGYSSQECPHCEEHADQIGIRVKSCANCSVVLGIKDYVKYHHRDVMAGENLAIAAREIGRTGKRPAYLTKDKKGHKSPSDRTGSHSSQDTSQLNREALP